MTSIDPISKDIEWSARAAAGDALSRVEDKTPFIAIWIKDDGNISWSKANLTYSSMCQLSSIIQEMTNIWSRNLME